MSNHDHGFTQLLRMYCEGSDLGWSSSRIIGNGEMAEKIRRFNWERTPLGRIETWSETLVSTVNLLLASRHPMFLWWGPELIQFYNDSYRPSISDDKHSTAIGQRGVECWPEIWPLIGPQIDAVMRSGSSIFNANQLVPIRRNGKLEEVFWTYSYSPVRGSNGAIAGTLVVCIETTEQVLNERRLRALLAIHAESLESPPPTPRPLLAFAQAIVQSLARSPADCPFAALYLSTPEGILQAGGTGANGVLADPERWPLANLVDSHTPLLIEDLQQRVGELVCKPWPEPLTQAYLLPLHLHGASGQAVLVLGISPRLPFDNSYQTFFHLVGARIASLLQSEILQLDRVERTNLLEHQVAVLAEKAALLDLTQDAVVVRDLHDQILFWNRGAEAMYGWPRQEAIGKNSFELLKSELSVPAKTMKATLLSQGHWEGEATHRRRDGASVIVSSRSALQRDANGDPIRVLTMNHEITGHKQAESKLRLLTERLSLATTVARVGVWEWDIDSNTLTWDATMFDIYGLPPVVPMPYDRWSSTVHPEDLPEVETTLRKVLDEKGRGSAEFRIVLADGSIKNISAAEGVVLDERGQVIRVIGVNIDVTERARAEAALRKSAADMTHLAAHDFLTGLPNRMLVHDRVNQAIALASRHRTKVAVLFLDLDGFKHINDSLGHTIGDKLLQSVANRIEGCLRTSDTVSRQGGDEFVVLLLDVNHPEDTAVAARRLLNVVKEAHSIDGHDLHVTASIGVSVFPSDGPDAETLIKNADIAMYQAKENGRQSYQFFKADMNVRAIERQSIEENLRRALDHREFSVLYQPKVNLKTGNITGAEALLRWTHPVRGLISPAQFIPVAEDCGLIIPIGRWVLREACQQARVWIEAGLPTLNMAVNISAMEFRNENFLEELSKILHDTDLDPSLLELEITESVLMKYAESTASMLKAVRSSGVHLALDDFGTGYSSLSYLRKFPIDTLKIDQSFIRQITAAPPETAIVSAIIGMGRNLNLRVVAEGVETLEELAFLDAQDCSEGQGYYFSRPLDAAHFARLLETWVPETLSQ